MKFNCESCEAKYKIADEKVVGRTLRMACRKCGSEIIIHGKELQLSGDPGRESGEEAPITREYASHPPNLRSSAGSQPAASQPAPPQPAASQPAASQPVPSQPARHSSPVSQGTRSSPSSAGYNSSLAPEVPLPSPVPQAMGDAIWHVSINDVPVGPITLEELTHKMETGSISEYSLVWRDEFDEWRPLATVPELLSLLQHQRASMRPPPEPAAPVGTAAMTQNPFGGSMGGPLPISQPPPASQPPAVRQPPPASQPSAVSQPLMFEHDLGSQPRLSPMPGSFPADSHSHSGLTMPSGPPSMQSPLPQGPSSAPASSPSPLNGSSQHFEGVHSSIPSAPVPTLSSVPPAQPMAPIGHTPAPMPSQMSPAPKTSAAPTVVNTILVLAAMSFSFVAGYYVRDVTGPRDASVESSPPPVVAEAPAPAPAPAPVPPTERRMNLELEMAPELPPPTQPVDTISAAPSSRGSSRTTRPAIKRIDAKESEPSALSDSDKRLLAKFGDSGNAAPAKINLDGFNSAKKTTNKELDADAVKSTVNKGRPGLRRCYERAIRGQALAPSVRMDVDLVVAPSGRVKSVTANGSGPGGFKQCIEGQMRRWRFPASSEGGPAKFPVVFSGAD